MFTCEHIARQNVLYLSFGVCDTLASRLVVSWLFLVCWLTLAHTVVIPDSLLFANMSNSPGNSSIKDQYRTSMAVPSNNTGTLRSRFEQLSTISQTGDASRAKRRGKHAIPLMEDSLLV